jgi:hypothetical protein
MAAIVKSGQGTMLSNGAEKPMRIVWQTYQRGGESRSRCYASPIPSLEQKKKYA